tara:strand:- start:876 stop:1232 length:357 start_codon:yes stop_codon:yes gene_type:complete
MEFEYFKIKEFACKCGCKTNNIDLDFIEDLDRARSYSRIKYKITSGYRCRNHPLSIKNPTSSHIKGLAADIQCKDNYDRAVILGGLAEAGFVRIGLSKDGFIHVDSDQDKAQPVIWLY